MVLHSIAGALAKIMYPIVDLDRSISPLKDFQAAWTFLWQPK